MNRQRAAYLGAAAFLGVVGLASVGAVFAFAPEHGTVTEAATVPEPDSTPVARALPVDIATTGVARLIAQNTAVSSTPPTTSERNSRVCDHDLTGWVRSESARTSGPEASVSIQVAGYRAGAASEEFSALVSAAQQCSSVDAQAGQDIFVATRSETDGELAFGVVRQGDVLSVASASSRNGDPAGVVNRALQNARQTMIARLRAVCVDPSSTSNATHPARDPYSPSYSGFTVRREIPLPNQPPLSSTQVALVRADQPSPSWVAPRPTAYPALAPIAKQSVTDQPVVPTSPTPTPSDTVDPGLVGLVRDPAPLLVDPKTIRPPSQPRPVTDPGAEPTLPRFGARSATAMVPTRDTEGPGCGWQFAATTAPRISDAAIEAGTRTAVIEALVSESAAQGQAMVEALTWPSRHAEWVAAARVAADWDAYDKARLSAETAMQAARNRYDESVRKWREGLLEPTPTPTPSDSASPTNSAGTP